MCETLQGFHEHYSRMAIVGVTSELIVVLGFWGTCFGIRMNNVNRVPTIDDDFKAPAHSSRQAGMDFTKAD